MRREACTAADNGCWCAAGRQVNALASPAWEEEERN
uniref:Uncharacterized protein n=1 Tax=Arundo donax TaxID=35708 RepID=A0A0A9C4T7_ARUDO